MNNKAKRSPAMDVIRCLALLTVVCLHFFTNIDFPSTPVNCLRMYIMTAMRSFFMICVPLFLVLSGYLLKNKTLSKAYYLKLFYTIGIYILSSLACAAYSFISQPETFSFFGAFLGLFNFTTANYSWYVEMYIGLFLLIPFLNLSYNGLNSQKQKLGLVITMIVLTALPSVLNTYQFTNLQWWLNPSSNLNYDLIFPEWWVGFYPITYYFIGCYLKDYPIKIKTSKNALYIILAFVVFGIYNCYRSYGVNYVGGEWTEHKSLLNVIQTVLFFNFFANLKYEKINAKCSKFLAYLSKLTLGAYLCSWIFDSIFYQILNSRVSDIHLRLNYFVIMVPAVYICSLALSALLNWIYDILAKACTSIFNKSKNQENIA